MPIGTSRDTTARQWLGTRSFTARSATLNAQAVVPKAKVQFNVRLDPTYTSYTVHDTGRTPNNAYSTRMAPQSSSLLELHGSAQAPTQAHTMFSRNRDPPKRVELCTATASLSGKRARPLMYPPSLALATKNVSFCIPRGGRTRTAMCCSIADVDPATMTGRAKPRSCLSLTILPLASSTWRMNHPNKRPLSALLLETIV